MIGMHGSRAYQVANRATRAETTRALRAADVYLATHHSNWTGHVSTTTMVKANSVVVVVKNMVTGEAFSTETGR